MVPTREGDDNIRVSPSLELLHPGLGSVEGILLRDVVDYYCGRGASVVHGRQTAVPFLPSCIPYLELEVNSRLKIGFSLESDCLGEKGGSDGGLLLGELVTNESQYET